MSRTLYIHGVTDIGQNRPTNQDQFLIADLNRVVEVRSASHIPASPEETSARLFMVADGMGGRHAGARASELAIEGVVDYMVRRMPLFVRDAVAGEDAIGRHLQDALLHCCELLKQETRRAPDLRGMGTTATVALLSWPHLHVAHVGDSRCYRLRKGSLSLLTRDHTLSQLYRETQQFGDYSAEESERLNNTLWNVISAGEKLEPEVGRYVLEDDDQVLLCTDGLYKQLKGRHITATLCAAMETRTACEKLIEDANRAGGPDNITAVLARRRDVPRPERTGSLADTVEYDRNAEP